MRSERLKMGTLPPGFHWQCDYPQQFKTVLTIMPVSKMKMKDENPHEPDTDFTYNHFICCKLKSQEKICLICGKRFATGGNNSVSNCQRHTPSRTSSIWRNESKVYWWCRNTVPLIRVDFVTFCTLMQDAFEKGIDPLAFYDIVYSWFGNSNICPNRLRSTVYCYCLRRY